MDYQEYKSKAQMAHSEKTIQDRKSYLRLFDVWLYQLRQNNKEPGEAVLEFRSLDRSTRMNYEFSEYEPEDFSEIQRFILFLYEELDFSRTHCRHYFDAVQSYCKRLNLEVYSKERFYMFREDNLSTSYNPNYGEDSIFTLSEISRLVEELSKPSKDFLRIQYLHCRRPGEVKELRVKDFDLPDRSL
jgi:integrase